MILLYEGGIFVLVPAIEKPWPGTQAGLDV